MADKPYHVGNIPLSDGRLMHFFLKPQYGDGEPYGAFRPGMRIVISTGEKNTYSMIIKDRVVGKIYELHRSFTYPEPFASSGLGSYTGMLYFVILDPHSSNWTRFHKTSYNISIEGWWRTGDASDIDSNIACPVPYKMFNAQGDTGFFSFFCHVHDASVGYDKKTGEISLSIWIKFYRDHVQSWNNWKNLRPIHSIKEISGETPTNDERTKLVQFSCTGRILDVGYSTYRYNSTDSAYHQSSSPMPFFEQPMPVFYDRGMMLYSNFTTRITSIEKDYLICNLIDDDNYVNNSDFVSLKVAKPYQLMRTPFHQQTVNGVTYNYIGSEAQKRVATKASVSQNQFVTPKYHVGDEVIATMAHAGTYAYDDSGNSIGLVDVNCDARFWQSESE